MPTTLRRARRSYRRDRKHRRSQPTDTALSDSTRLSTSQTPLQALQPPLLIQPPPSTPYKPPTSLLRYTVTHTTLTTHLNLLHLLHARNRNQHRRSTFYRPLLTLRRQLHRLLHQDLALSAKSIDRKRAVKERITFWVKSGLVEKWYAAFEGLTRREGVRFAGVGLTGMGVLAGVMRETGVTAWLEGLGEARRDEGVRRVLERFVEEEGADNKEEREDLGEVVERTAGV